MHVIYAGLARLGLCFIFKSFELTREDLSTECMCVYTCNTFSIVLFHCLLLPRLYDPSCSYLMKCLLSSMSYSSLSQSFFLLTFLSWNKGLNGLKFSWAEGKMNWVLVEFLFFFILFFYSQMPQFCQEWNSKKNKKLETSSAVFWQHSAENKVLWRVDIL